MTPETRGRAAQSGVKIQHYNDSELGWFILVPQASRMIVINEIIVSEDLIDSHFHCDLTKCKGACCVEGEFGAPLEGHEIGLIEEQYHAIRPSLSQAGINCIEKKGFHTFYQELEGEGTMLLDNGACVFAVIQPNGIVSCGIEKSYREGRSGFIKPISCHLYPVRVNSDKELQFEALNYDRWEICKSGCTLGASRKLPLYKFVRDGIIRKYGINFYETLEKVANKKI